MQWIVLFREADGRVVTLVADAPNAPHGVCTILYDSYDDAFSAAVSLGSMARRPTAVAQAPAMHYPEATV